MSGLGQRATDFGIQASAYQTSAQKYSNISKLGMQIGGFAMGNAGTIGTGISTYKANQAIKADYFTSASAG